MALSWTQYTQKTDSIPWLKAHRDWVEKHDYGFGDRALHYMWYELLRELDEGAKLLEVGVFKGQTISLWGLISNQLGKDLDVYGVTKLGDEMADKYHKHQAVTRADIERICANFGAKVTVWDADSRSFSPCPPTWDLVFIDGGHDYETVVSDIDNFAPGVKPGGFLVFDDVDPGHDYGHWYRGLEDVTRAVSEFAASRNDFEHYRQVGYVRIFKCKRR